MVLDRECNYHDAGVVYGQERCHSARSDILRADVPIEELAVRHTSTGKALDFDTLANIGEVHVACAHANTVNHSERKQLDGLFPFGDVAHMLGHQELM